MRKLYLITHRETKEEAMVVAESAQEACEKQGWLVGECYIKELARKVTT